PPFETALLGVTDTFDGLGKTSERVILEDQLARFARHSHKLERASEFVAHEFHPGFFAGPKAVMPALDALEHIGVSLDPVRTTVEARKVDGQSVPIGETRTVEAHRERSLIKVPPTVTERTAISTSHRRVMPSPFEEPSRHEIDEGVEVLSRDDIDG